VGGKKAQKGKYLRRNKKGSIILYITTIIFSILFLFIGNKIATKNLTIYSAGSGQKVFKARVEEISDRVSNDHSLNENTKFENIQVTFTAKILSGDKKGETVTAYQNLGGLYFSASPEIKAGDKVLLIYSEQQKQTKWQFMEFVRSDKLVVFGILFGLALLLFGRIKGFNTLISLAFTCAAIFAVFIPSILSGKNIYISSIVICLYTITMTYLIVDGGNRKTFAAALGCLGGITVSGVLTVIMDKVLALTGYVDEESIYLTNIAADSPINLKAIIFAAILIGAMGAIMDVSMSMSSSLWEVKEKSASSSVKALFKSGMNIGRDIMGTMANTLILAYIGSSLSVVLLLTAYSTSLTALINREMVVVEILQALVGSFGILFTIPLTSLICAMIYTKNNNNKYSGGLNRAAGPDVAFEEVHEDVFG